VFVHPDPPIRMSAQQDPQTLAAGLMIGYLVKR